MPNVTISLDEKLLKASEDYATNHNTSLNKLLRKLLTNTVQSSSARWLDECFKLMDQAGADSKGKHWRREYLYDE